MSSYVQLWVTVWICVVVCSYVCVLFYVAMCSYVEPCVALAMRITTCEPASGTSHYGGRYFIYDYYYVPKHSYYILLYIIIITL